MNVPPVFKNPHIQKIAGIFLITLGILGLFLPFLQGIAMIGAGVYLLDNRWVAKKTREFLAVITKKDEEDQKGSKKKEK